MLTNSVPGVAVVRLLTAPLRAMKHQRDNGTLQGLFTCAAAWWTCGKRVCILEFAMHLCRELVLSVQLLHFAPEQWGLQSVKCSLHTGMYIYGEYQKSVRWNQFLKALLLQTLSIFHFLLIASSLIGISSLFAVYSKACASACKFKALLTPS